MRVHRWACVLVVERPIVRTMMGYPTAESGLVAFAENEHAPEKSGVGMKRAIGAALLTHSEGRVLAEWGDWLPLGAPSRPGSEDFYPLIEGTFAWAIGPRKRHHHRLALRGLRDKSFLMDPQDPDFYPDLDWRGISQFTTQTEETNNDQGKVHGMAGPGDNRS